jgi:hypothetical protein
MVKDENGNLFADSHILNMWKNFLSLLLKVHTVNDIRQMEKYTAEPLVPDPSHFEVEIATAKFKKYKSPGSDQIPADRFKQEMKHYILRCIN